MIKFQSFLFAIILAFSHAQSDTFDNATTTTTARSDISTSTAAVSTSVSPISTTTTLAPPVPASLPPTWTVKSSNSTCVLVRGNFSFAVTYADPAGNTISDKVDIPASAKASGSCAPFINSLVLTWDKNNLTFMFIKKPIYNAGVDTGEGSYSLTTIFGKLIVENPNAGNSSTNSNSPTKDSSSDSASSGQSFNIAVRQPGFMDATLHNSYSCESYQSVVADYTGSVYLEMKGIQVEAFHNGADANFSTNQPCTKDTMSSVMTMVGYAALAVVVAAVVGYLAWKKFGRGGYTEV